LISSMSGSFIFENRLLQFCNYVASLPACVKAYFLLRL
jgi:hypothetical protein